MTAIATGSGASAQSAFATIAIPAYVSAIPR
jgi:hypothetical protein